MKRGDVYWADLAPRSGSEQQGRRPVVVISHDAFNKTQSWRSIIVVPLSTSVAQAGRGPSAVLLSQGTAGLGKDSVALCHLRGAKILRVRPPLTVALLVCDGDCDVSPFGSRG